MDQQTVIQVLVWVSVGCAGLFLSLLTWVALRIISQGEEHSKQLGEIKQMVIDELHALDKRMVRVEERIGINKRAEDKD